MTEMKPPAQVFEDCLHCPRDGSLLRIEILECDADLKPRTGLLMGADSVYPMILGIPRLLNDALRGPLVAMLRRGDFDNAASLALNWPDKSMGNRVRRKAIDLLMRTAPNVQFSQQIAAGLSTGRPLLRGSGATETILRELSTGFFTDWLIHRFSARTFRPLQVLAQLIGPTERVLDIGGGLGHGAWVLSSRVPVPQITLVDSVFAHLHVARSRLVPGLTCICADVQAGLPLGRAQFDSVVMSDTFHFVPQQAQLAREALRVLGPKGRVILSQIHNSQVADDFTGAAVTPDVYMSYFEGVRRSLVTNASLLEGWCNGAPLELTERSDLNHVEGIAELSMVVDRGGASFASAHDPRPDNRNIEIASLLQPGRGGQVELRSDIAPIVAPFLDWPDVSDVTWGDLEYAKSHPGPRQDSFLRNGHLVSVPVNYFAKPDRYPTAGA